MSGTDIQSLSLSEAPKIKLCLDTFPVEIIVKILQNTDLTSLASFSKQSSRLRAVAKENAQDICNALTRRLFYALQAEDVFVTDMTEGWCVADHDVLKAFRYQGVSARRSGQGVDMYWPSIDHFALSQCTCPTPSFLYLLEKQATHIELYGQLIRRYMVQYFRLQKAVANGLSIDDSTDWIVSAMFGEIADGMEHCDGWFMQYALVDISSLGELIGLRYPKIKELVWFFGAPSEDEKKRTSAFRSLNYNERFDSWSWVSTEPFTGGPRS